MKVLLLMIVGIALADFTCQRYTCNEKELELNKQCVNHTVNSTQISPCGKVTVNDEELEEDRVKELFCYKPPDMGQESYCTIRDFIEYLLPGERCNVTRDCTSGNCTERNSCKKGTKCDKSSKLCRGRGERDFCSSDNDCNEELYCGERGICIPTITAGKGCNEEKKCESNSFCYKGNCTVFGSLEIGTPATVVAACRTYFIHEGKCAIGPKRKGDHICPHTNVCTYTLAGEDKTEPCVCARNKEGSKFCPPGLGDIDITPVITLIRISL